MRKTSIFGHFGPKWPILDSFWPKWAKREFFQKALGTFFSRLQALTNCKVSEKNNERFLSNRVTLARTHGGTWILRSPTTSPRDQKIFFLKINTHYWNRQHFFIQKKKRMGNWRLFAFFVERNQFLVSRRSRWRPKDSRPCIRTYVRAYVRHAVARKPFITFFWNFAVN